MEYLILIILFLFSVVIHEVSHGAVAFKLGDSTAKYAGRLTLNPLKHLELFGSIILPLVLIIMAKIAGGGFVFGWAKPVPYNPYNLKNQKWGPALVAAAGPGANLIVALIFGISLRFLPITSSVYIYNLAYIFSIIVWINILLAIFNLVPIPPLDGSKILFAALPYRYENIRVNLERYGFFVLIFFIFFLFQYLLPVVHGLFRLITGLTLF
jgi:Zn-dependent protease